MDAVETLVTSEQTTAAALSHSRKKQNTMQMAISTRRKRNQHQTQIMLVVVDVLLKKNRQMKHTSFDRNDVGCTFRPS